MTAEQQMRDGALDALRGRAIASSEDRASWHAARAFGVTGSDIRRLRSATPAGRASMIAKKLAGGDEVRELNVRELVWGRVREDEIAGLVWARFRIEPNRFLFHARENRRHLATPDGVGVEEDFDSLAVRVVTSEIKTGKFELDPSTSEHFGKYGYYDQVQWELYVAGGWRARFTWEQHDDDWSYWPEFGPRPLAAEPQGVWILRDDARITELVAIADDFLATLDAEAARDPEERDFELEALFADLVVAREQASAAEGALRSYLDATRRESAVTPLGKLSYGMGNGSVRFDSSAFKRDHPDLFAEYVRRSVPRKKTLRLNVAGAKRDEDE